MIRTRYFEDTAHSTSWDGRDQRLFWRGVLCGGGKKRQMDGNRERKQASTISRKHKDMLDVKLGHGIEMSTYCKRKYLLNMPGARRGGYSRNLNHLWSMGSVVVQWESEPGKGLNYEEYYYPGLTTNTTHMVANEDNMVHLVKYLRNNDSFAKHLGHTATQVHHTFLCPCCIVNHFQAVFQALKPKMNVDLQAALQKDSAWMQVTPQPKAPAALGSTPKCGYAP
eukprot:gnl/TRDRNA2_/TRDRNA2_172068_c3_seq3.p1 gnl/TRDRNA2_/TRDRNA2_172068_c3~~gnl/TRDRNA2_/TRDRNA2_172068_c3_seq3.p1  ORF type:complete len:224 (+),score=13.43 gnl/TRDRNA2_/TRDRNA2_172068_c3_seq3:173-844(+)